MGNRDFAVFHRTGVPFVGGLGGFADGIGAIGCIRITGFVVDHFIATHRSSLSPPFCPFWARWLCLLGGPIRRITLEEAKIPN
jgi:hypothetical protein